MSGGKKVLRHRVLTDSEVKVMAANLYRLVYLNNLAQVLADCLDSVCVDMRCVCQRLGDASRREVRARFQRMVELTRGIGRLQTVVCKDVRLCEEGGLSGIADGINEILQMFMPGADVSDASKARLLALVENAFEAMKKGQQLDVDYLADTVGIVRKCESEILSKMKAKGGDGYA